MKHNRILGIIETLWAFRNLSTNMQFLAIVELFMGYKCPLAGHAHDYLKLIQTAESQSIERTKGKITITFTGDL